METIPLPTNLPLLINDLPEWKRQGLSKVLSGEAGLAETLYRLSQNWKIKVWFSAPVQIRTNCYKTKTTAEHVFSGFFISREKRLCYTLRANSLSGYPIGDIADKIIRYEPITYSDEFKCYEAFKRKFDLQFIKEEEILRLWNGKSSQHGGQYKPSDFRDLSEYGVRVMARFLERFKGLGIEGPTYHTSPYGDYKVLDEHYTSSGRQGSHFGRDIHISYQTNSTCVHYASEYPGCGNGRYGLIANKKQYLWLEDD